MNTKRTRKQYKRIDEYTVIRDNVYKIKIQEYIDDLIHERLDNIMMDDLTISFHLKWRNGTEDLIRQFKDCQNEEELLELIKDNMIISIPINNDRLIGVIKLQEILRNITLIKHYNFEKSYPDERIYLCADHIEQELQKLRYSNNHILETDW